MAAHELIAFLRSEAAVVAEVAATVGNAHRMSDQAHRAMTKTARVYKIEMLIRNRGHVSFQALLDELEISAATLKRDLDYLKDRLGAPIVYDRYLNGYKFGEEHRGQKHELPGLWFNERELYSLLMAHQLLSELDWGASTLAIAAT